MYKTIMWPIGHDQHIQHSIIDNLFVTEFKERSKTINTDPIIKQYASVLAEKNARIGVLYSGGVDSEVVLRACVEHSIPVTAWTTKLCINGVLINPVDIYYATSFCSRLKIPHKLLTLELLDFYHNGDWEKYAYEFNIDHFWPATHHWLLDRVEDFPVIGGDVPYPRHNQQTGELEFEPTNVRHSGYELNLAANKREGITNMARWTESIMLSYLKIYAPLFKEHGKKFCGDRGIKYYTHVAKAINKHVVYSRAGFVGIEPRVKVVGLEFIDENDLPITQINQRIRQQLPELTNVTVPSKRMMEILKLYE